MQRRGVIVILGLLWAAGMGWSAWALFGMTPSGDGLARGMNKIFGFMVGQAAAGMSAVLALILGWRMADRRDKWLSRGPALLSLLIALGVSGLVLRSRQIQSEALEQALEKGQEQAPKPVTVPAPAD